MPNRLIVDRFPSVWIQKSWDKLTTNGVGGYVHYPGFDSRNWALDRLHRISAHVLIGVQGVRRNG